MYTLGRSNTAFYETLLTFIPVVHCIWKLIQSAYRVFNQLLKCTITSSLVDVVFFCHMVSRVGRLQLVLLCYINNDQ